MAGESLPTRLAESTGTIFYVDNVNGSDARSEAQAQVEATPWATIQKALNTITPGNHAGGPRIYVKDTGTPYAEAIEWAPPLARAADATHPISIIGVGGKPKVQPPGSPPDWMVHVYKSGSYYGSHIRIRNVEFLNFNKTSAGGIVGLYADASAQYIEVDNVWFHDLAPLGAAGRASAIFGGGPCDHIQVWNSQIWNIDASHVGQDGLSHGVYMEGDHFYMVNTLVHHCGNGFGIQLYSSSENATNLGVYHCTSADNYKSGLVLLHRYSNVAIRNSIFAFNGNYGIEGYVEGSPAGTNQTADRVVCHGNTNGASYTAGTPLVITNQRTTDPLFVNRTLRDYRLQAGGSPIDWSDAAYAPATDIIGTARG